MAAQPQGGKKLPFTTLSRLGKAKAKEFTIQGLFKYGYRNKEDISNLPPETLVVGSQNVLTNAAELVGIRQGYVLDGPAGNQNTYGIDSNYDFYTRIGTVQNLRKWGSNLEVRYYNPNTKLVSWINIFSSLNAGKVMNFTSYYDQLGEQSNFCLFVNGDKNVYEWSGGVGSVASVSNASGIIASITTLPNSDANTSGGIGYKVGDTLTITGGGGTGATVQVTAINPGGVVSATYIGGSGYNIGDKVRINNGAVGGQSAIVQVTAVNGSNQITGATVVVVGSGFTGAGQYTLTAISGGGSGGNANITALGTTIASINLITNGSGYSAASNNAATTGGSGAGATIEILTVGANSITLQGTNNLQQLGFYSTSANNNKFNLLINGITYTYTASNANGGQTFVGITPTPVGAGISAGDAVVQMPVIGVSASASFIDAHWVFDLISTLNNQVWYGSLTRSDVYFSQASAYTTLTPSATLAQGGAGSGSMDASVTALYPQGGQMYIAAGVNEWWVGQFQIVTQVVSGSAVSTQIFYLNRLKTAVNQGAQSQALVTQFKNALVYVSNEPIVNSFGLVKNIYSNDAAAPQITNISDPIKYDMDAYNFTGGSVYYFNYFIYVAIPAMSVVRMYNVIKKYWEAPQILPVSRFYQINGVLYGHSALTNESYQMFTGYNDNGNPINAVAAFPYLSLTGGNANEKKDFNKILTEGYISANTALTLGINYDFGGYSGSYSVVNNGNNLSPKNIIFNKVTDGSLGQNTLGSQPIGQVLNLSPQAANPKFRVINTMPRVPVYEYQIIYSSNDIDQQWALLRFGPAINSASATAVEITN